MGESTSVVACERRESARGGGGGLDPVTGARTVAAPVAEFGYTCPVAKDRRRWRCFMGDKGGKKDKEKGQKQHVAKDKQDDKRKLEKQPKRNA